MYKPSLTVAKTEHIAVPVGEHKLSLDVAKHEKVVFHPIDARVNAVDQGGLFPANPIEGMGQGSDGATATTPADSDRSPQDLTPPSTPSLGLPASSANGASSDSGPTLYAYIGGEFPPQPTETAASRDDGGERGSTTPFKVAYLTPLFVLLGLFFVFSVGGWVWGRAWHSKEREIRRRSKHARRLARDQHKAELQRIQAGWAEQGWGSPSSRRTRGPEKDATDSELDSEDDYEVSGPFSALGRRLMGAGGRSVPPLSRPRAGRYEAGVQSNSWWRVRLARAFGPKGDENNRGAYTAANRPSLKHLPSRERLRRARTDTDVEGGLLMQEKNPETQEPLSRKSSVLRATLRGTWNRIKHCIPVRSSLFAHASVCLTKRLTSLSHTVNIVERRMGILWPHPRVPRKARTDGSGFQSRVGSTVAARPVWSLASAAIGREWPALPAW